MEKRSITGKDILRMDGLLPPTRRLPVCDAVSSSEKKKDKKWSIGGILKRISSIRDYDSSSNDEEMVYCTRQPRPRTVFNRKSHNVVLQPVDKSVNQRLNKSSSSNDIITNSVDTPSLQRDSTHSRSSDGSLDGLSKKTRKSKLKARIEAKRDQICGDSSSDEDSQKSWNSPTKYQNENAMQNMQKNSSCNRKSRAARTERYIKRLSKDEGHKFPENLNNIANKRNSLDFMGGNQSPDVDTHELFQPAIQSQQIIAQSNSYTFPVQRSVENSRQLALATSNCQTQSSSDLTKHFTKRYVTDLNQNNTYAKPNILKKDKNYTNYEENNYFSNSLATNIYARPYDHTRNGQLIHQSSSPPEPPPRDPRCRVFAYSCNSFPFNEKYRVTKYDDAMSTKMDHIHDSSKNRSNNLRSYESNNEISWCGSTKHYPRRPLSLTVTSTQSCTLSECTNNKHNSTGRHVDEPMFRETEAMRCQRRNNRNDQLNSCFNDYDIRMGGNKLSTTYPQNISTNILSPTYNKMSNSSFAKSSKLSTQQHAYNSANNTFVVSTKAEKKEEKQAKISEQEALETRRSSKNLEEALSELEAIYNSLRLGDEELLDRAERRSMEEFSLRRAKTDDIIGLAVVDSPDRTKDDMAYRRMHPKERPTSLSDVVGQSALSNISYLMASPILARKDATDDYLYVSSCPIRRDEPDVTLDDVVYRSIHHANNTLKVIDPQPPFGIPLGPVTTATESDYLHTTPSKPDHPRSSYIPQCEPDIVTDDLAYRTLRKDANTTKNAVESKSVVAKDQETTFGMKKKRAVRSLSANLYGLINHDRIHLRREPSLQEIKDEVNETMIDIKSLSARSDCFRRVVSDGELSDYDTRWRTESSLKNSKIDINGNHPISSIHRKKLRVYVSPSTQIQNLEKNEDDTKPGDPAPSNDILSKALSNEFWQDRLQSKSKELSKKETESDFTAYSRLCQDLVNLVDGQNDTEEVKPFEETLDVDLEQSVKLNNANESDNTGDFSVVRIQTLGSHYSKDNKENGVHTTSNDDIERLTTSIVNLENEDLEKTDDSVFDFYLRVADENVKLIAEAFSSVADRLRDSRLSQKNSLTSCRSEIETDSTAPNTSARNSLSYSQDDVNDDLSSSSKTTDILDIVPKENTLANVEGDSKEIEQDDVKDNCNVNPELDLSRAVHDLQLAAARLCEHEKEIEELEALLKRDASDNIPCTSNVSVIEEKSLIAERSSTSKSEVTEQECDREEETVISTDVKLRFDEHDPNREGESTKCNDVCKSYDVDNIARSSGMRFSYVTNLITVMITTYSVVLLACFLALLLATVAAS